MNLINTVLMDQKKIISKLEDRIKYLTRKSEKFSKCQVNSICNRRSAEYYGVYNIQRDWMDSDHSFFDRIWNNSSSA
jgi:hypothetical protein